MLSSEELDRLCKLARLKLSETETAPFLDKLDSILEWVRQLQTIDTSTVKEEATTTLSLPERKDVVSEGDCREAVLLNSPSKKFDMFAVPKVVE